MRELRVNYPRPRSHEDLKFSYMYVHCVKFSSMHVSLETNDMALPDRKYCMAIGPVLLYGKEVPSHVRHLSFLLFFITLE
mmetsp:Transcript_540/g.1192  ORF Transcript_540/g.1192 Transcript_540/m.1192 type:complete len:80 (+) Transcript_540:348-587(+)